MITKIFSTAGLLGMLAVLFSGCESGRPERITFEEAAYSTVFLGPGGTIVRDPRAPEPGSIKKKCKDSPTAHRPSLQGHWEGDGVSGSPSITIDLTRQKATFFKGGKVVGVSPVSTGREGYRTPAGRFRVSQKNASHVSNLYGDYVDADGNVVMGNVGVKRDARPAGTRFRGAPMPYFMRVHGAVGMHGGYLPGYPASHGCIRLPMEMARTYFQHAPPGTPVIITH